MSPVATPWGRQARWFTLVSLLTAAATCAAHPVADAADRPEHEIQPASARALDWIERHPATPDDGGLPDMIDEGVSLRVFQHLATTAAESGRFARLFRARMARLGALIELQRWVEQPHKALIDHYHLVLAAYLMEGAGLNSPLVPMIRQQAQRALAAATFEPPTVRLTTALFLSRLAGAPAVDMQDLLASSMIEQLGHNRHFIALPGAEATAQQRRKATWLLYALVHEVVALTDFGRILPSPWLAARRDAVAEVLLEAVPWAGAQHNWDLAAELVVTLYFLDQPLTAELQAVLDDLVAHQQPDGSWGASASTSRRNKLRHTVLTSAAVLLARRAWCEDRLTQDAAR
jgi:hypothetical protein